MKAKTVRARWVLAATGVGMLGSVVRAASIYCDGAAGNSLWTSVATWSTSSTATAPNPAGAPGSADDVIFNISGTTVASTIKLGGTQSAHSLRFRQNGATTITNNGGGETLNLGGNLTADAGTGTVTLSMSNLVLTGDSTWTNSKTVDITILATNTVGNATTGSSRTLTLSNAASGAIAITGAVGDGGGGGNLAVLMSGSGTGAIKFSGANTYTGGTTLSAGWVQVGVDGIGSAGSITSGAFGAGSLFLNGGTLTSTNNASHTILNPVVFGGDVILGATSTQAGPLTFSADADLGSAVRTLTVNSSVQFDGVVSNSGGGLTKAGGGMLTLGRANTYSGTTNITGGTLKYNTNDVIASGPVTVNGSTAWLDLGDSHTDTVGTVTLDGGGQISGAGTSALTSTGTFELRNGSVAVPLAGTGIALNKTTAGTVTMSGANTYTGVTTLSEGTLSLSAAEIAGVSGPLGRSVASNPGSIALAGGWLQYSTVNQYDYSGRFSTAAGQQYNVDIVDQTVTVTWATPLTSPGGSLSKSGIGTLILLGANTYSANTAISTGLLQLGDGTAGHDGSVAGNIVNNAALSYNLSGSRDYGGAISGTGTVTKFGNGTLILSGANTYGGITQINGGIMQFARAASLYGGITGNWTKTNLTVASGATAAFNVGGANEFSTANVTTLLTNLGGLGGGVSSNGLMAGSSIGFDTTNAIGGSFMVADKIANSTGTSGGPICVTKLGANTLVFSGNNTYTGATRINAGTLLVNGSLASGSAVTVASGATLGGNGTVSGSVTVAGTIAPGNGTVGSISTLTTGAQTWSDGGVYEVDIAKAIAGATPATVRGTDQDYLVISSLTLPGGFTVKPITAAGGPNGFAPGATNAIYEWVIARVTGASSPIDLTGVNLITSSFAGGSQERARFSLLSQADAAGGQDVVLKYTYSAVPEATTVLLAIVGLTPVLLQRRRGA